MYGCTSNWRVPREACPQSSLGESYFHSFREPVVLSNSLCVR